MAVKKYLKNNAGVLTEEATGETGGAGDAGKIPNLDSNGRLPAAMMPTGIAADTYSVQASENLAAGDFVNIHNSSGAKARKADATTAGKRAHGFVLAAVTSGQNATVYFEGLNDQVTGLTPGDVYLHTTAGAATGTAPSSTGNVVQHLGVAVSATAINVELGPPITLA